MNNDKDWTGNKKSVWNTLGASNHTDKDREENDYYATDPIAIDVLLDGGAEIANKILEPSAGEGHLAERLKELGYKVTTADLVERDYKLNGTWDFLSQNKKWHDGDILTNPPYKYAQDFVNKSLEMIDDGHKVFMFLKLQFLEGKGRRKLFDTKQLKTVYVSSSRILCAKNGDFEGMKAGGGSAVAYAWYEWEKGYNGDPMIKWIN